MVVPQRSDYEVRSRETVQSFTVMHDPDLNENDDSRMRESR